MYAKISSPAYPNSVDKIILFISGFQRNRMYMGPTIHISIEPNFAGRRIRYMVLDL